MLIGTAILAFATSISLPMIFSSIAIGSFCLSIVIYGLLTREYGLLINIGSYASSISLVISIIAALVSGYILLAGEYRSYYREIHDEDTINVPQWITLTVGTVVVLLCIFGLNIL